MEEDGLEVQTAQWRQFKTDEGGQHPFVVARQQRQASLRSRRQAARPAALLQLIQHDVDQPFFVRLPDVLGHVGRRA